MSRSRVRGQLLPLVYSREQRETIAVKHVYAMLALCGMAIAMNYASMHEHKKHV